MAFCAMLLAALIAVAHADNSIVTSQGWWSAWQGDLNGTLPYQYVLDGFTFACFSGTLLEKPDLSNLKTTWWQAHPTVDSKVVYTSLAYDAQGRRNGFSGFLINALWDHPIKSWVIRVCTPYTAWAKIVTGELFHLSCFVRAGEKLDDTDCPLRCFIPRGKVGDQSHKWCKVNLKDAACVKDPRCVPNHAHYRSIDGTGLLQSSGMDGCVAADKDQVTVEQCDSKADSQQWTINEHTTAAAV